MSPACNHEKNSMHMRRLVNGLLPLLLLAAAGCLPAQAQVPMARYVAGEHYTVIDNPVQPPDDGRVHVIEFFLYSCPHCYHFEDTINAWAAQLPDDVAYRKVPVLFGRRGKIYARMFYTEKQLGVFDQLHERIFDAIHQQGKPLDTAAAIRKFFVAHGVDGQAFDKAFRSKAVDQQIEKAGKLMRAFRVMAVPTMGVAGRYWISGRQAGSNKDMLDVVDYLIEKTREGQ